jgi:hypothetical protein
MKSLKKSRANCRKKPQKKQILPKPSNKKYQMKKTTHLPAKKNHLRKKQELMKVKK